ncbi:MAG: UTP--glucose-1-phosphate uridylyltransferase, partial [Rhodobacteraceae bacterium]
LEDYFDHAPQLEDSLKAKGKSELLDVLRTTNMESGAIAYIRQHKAMGLGHAVWCARRLIASDEPFAVILPDDVIAADKPCLQQMTEAYAETGGCMVAAMEVPREKTSAYGILDVCNERDSLVSVRGMVEKPSIAEAPSNLAVIGRYILTPKVLNNLTSASQGAGGEIQLTDAIAKEIKEGRPVHGLRFSGQRCDCGSKAGFLQATVSFALARSDLQDEFSAFLRDTVPLLRVAE